MLRILVVALLLVPVVATVAPEAHASACEPLGTGIYEVDSLEYNTCTGGFDRVNRLCGHCLA